MAALDEALTWARARSEVVIVRLGSDEYSAGDREPPPDPDTDPFPRWQDGTIVRPRPWGAPPDGSVQEMPWRLLLTVFAGKEDDVQRIAEVVATDVLERGRVLKRSDDGDGLVVAGEYTASGMDVAVAEIHKRCSKLVKQISSSGGYVLIGSDA